MGAGVGATKMTLDGVGRGKRKGCGGRGRSHRRGGSTKGMV